MAARGRNTSKVNTNGGERGTTVEERTARSKRYAKLVAATVSLLVLGVMSSGALAEGNPFSAVEALTGSTTGSSTDTSTTPPTDTTGESTPAPTTTGETTTSETETSPATTAATTTVTTTTAAPTGAPLPYIVSFADGVSDDDQRAQIRAAGGTPGDATPVLAMYALTFPTGSEAAGVAALKANSNVLSVDADLPRDTAGPSNDAQYADQWSLPRISWDQVYGSVNPAGSATVAILDTGIDASHPDLSGVVVPGKNIITNSGDGTADPNGHGTAMAGIVAASTNNGIGIAGVAYAGVKVMPVTVLSADGTGSDSDVINGVVYAVGHGANVILMSFSNPGYSAALQKAVDYAWNRGVVLVAATGNDGSSTVNYPAGDRGVLGVASTDSMDLVPSFSNSGADVFLAAPGVGILSTQAGGGYGQVSGTSASAAAVAGAAALIKASSVGASNGVIVNRLAANADPAGTSSQTGNGRLNLARAIADTSSTSVQPAGAGANGGPFVGPYQVANKNFIITFAGTGGGSVAFSGVTGSPAPSPTTCTGTPNPCNQDLNNTATGTLTVTCERGIDLRRVEWGVRQRRNDDVRRDDFSLHLQHEQCRAEPAVTFKAVSRPRRRAWRGRLGSNPSVYGSALTFTATVTGNPGAVSSVTLKDDADAICNAVSVSGSTATLLPSTGCRRVQPHGRATAAAPDSWEAQAARR